MARHPLFPVLQVGSVLVALLAILYAHRQSAPEAAPDGVWATDVDEVNAGSLRVGEKATGPLEGQKRPPCNREVDTEFAGACWIAAKRSPPCPAGLYEGAGECLVPVKAAQRPPTSLTQ